jgi:Tfp pilus assembly protein PilZ
MEVERRSGKRFSSRFGVVFNDDSGLNFSFITNLSRSGAFVNTPSNFQLGTLMNVCLSNGNYQAPIFGHVVRIQHGSQDDPQSQGVGIKFDNLTPCARRLRDDLLLYLMNLKYHREWN